MNLFAIWMVQFCFCIQRNLRSRTMAGRCLFYKKLPKFLLLPRSSTTTKQSTIHNILQDTFWRPLNNFVRMNLGVPFSTYLSRHPTQARPDRRLYIVYWKVLSALYRFPVSYYNGYYVVHPDPIKPFINITQAKFQTVSLIVEMPS